MHFPRMARSPVGTLSSHNSSTEMARLPNTWFMVGMEKLPSTINDTLPAYKDVWVLFQKKLDCCHFPPKP